MIDKDTLDEINENVDLLDYVQNLSPEPIEFGQQGKDFWANCPKHIDQTPSLSITPEKNCYYCHSCHRGGYIINWLMDYEGMSYQDAFSKALVLAGIDPGTICISDTYKYLKRLATLDKSEEKKEKQFLDESVLAKYPKEVVQEWMEEGITPSAMNAFGIRVDRLKNRIVYPVRDIEGRLLNIKARTRYKNYKQLKIPKYINYFEVGDMDYLQGLDVTLPYVRESGEVIIFEGIKSVMKAYGWGYKNCASAEKHNLTDEQIDLLVRLRVDIVFAYDSDVDYYDKEVRRELDLLKRFTNVYVIFDANKLLGGKDAKNAPVDCGFEVWKELYENKRKIT